MDDSKIRNMEEFASVSGISRPTISKYFNDPESVRASTRERIEAALERFDYRPNFYAMNQNRRLTKNIGIVVPYLIDPFFAEMSRRIENLVTQAGFRPLVLNSQGDRETEASNLESLRSIKPAGVLIAPLGRTSDPAVIQAFCDEVPTVLFDSNLTGIGHAFVGSDNIQFAGQIVDYLCRTGEPPCFFEMRTPPNPNANKRRQSYVHSMERLGNAPQVIKVEGEGWDLEEIGFQGGIQVIEERLLTGDTVLCSNDRLAIGFLAACYDKGLRVGRGPQSALRVAGMDDHPFSRFTCPPLTTVAQDYDAISGRAVETLLGMIEADDHQEGGRIEMYFEGKLIMRSSA